jgi:hypothetical protein
MLRKEESHPQMTRTHSVVFLKVPEYFCKWFWLVRNYLWMSKTFGFGHKVMVAAWSHFEQITTWLGRDVQTLLATVSDEFCGLICNHIISINCGDQPGQSHPKPSQILWLLGQSKPEHHHLWIILYDSLLLQQPFCHHQHCKCWVSYWGWDCQMQGITYSHPFIHTLTILKWRYIITKAILCLQNI